MDSDITIWFKSATTYWYVTYYVMTASFREIHQFRTFTSIKSMSLEEVHEFRPRHIEGERVQLSTSFQNVNYDISLLCILNVKEVHLAFYTRITIVFFGDVHHYIEVQDSP